MPDITHLLSTRRGLNIFNSLSKLIKLKFYPHFDKYISLSDIRALVTNPVLVQQNTFYPFLEYEKVQRSFGRNIKSRPIRYAARRDSYIYAHYRKILLEKYEEKLRKLHIDNHPIAYRKIPVSTNIKSGKCNIHFAKEAFNEIKNRGACFAIALDITKFFESITHKKLYKQWCNLLEVNVMPRDHLAVFKAITKYSVVNRDECYKKLGIDNKQCFREKEEQKLHLLQLCDAKIFREKICNSASGLVKQNETGIGIPQGSPISDLLANLYLMDFDLKLSLFAKKVGAYYLRYSDDILFICPPRKSILDQSSQYIYSLASEVNLQIKEAKTNITEFYYEAGVLAYRPYEAQKKNSMKRFEYLGFGFDGENAFIRDKTLSGYYRKMTFHVRAEAENLIKRFPGKTLAEIKGKIDFSKLDQLYGQIDEFESIQEKSANSYECWNFYSYAKRAANIMDDIGKMMLVQLRNRRKKLRELINIELEKKYNRIRFGKPNKNIAIV